MRLYLVECSLYCVLFSSSLWSALGLGLGLDLVSDWLVVMHTYLYYFRLSLSHCRMEKPMHCTP